MSGKKQEKIYLKDYQTPAFLIKQIYLDVSLDPTQTRVKSRMEITRNPDGKNRNADLVLNGEGLKLVSLKLQGNQLPSDDFNYENDLLTIKTDSPDEFILELENYCNPEANKALSGLYLSNGVYCTQCEAEGFRRFTFFSDRPDVLTIFTTRIEAEKSSTPILLGNGNLQEQGELSASGRHYAIWHDPHPKPSYLFALVGGKLENLNDSFTTCSGRKVDLNIYVEPGKQDRCEYAMDSLKRAMKWDEERFGCEYDLDVFNIVAVSDFNMGAMENKGLNIFNDKYILASPETSTDTDYANIEAIVAHEYFHNWTGNRITCRDWFQLCLKEGLTVFRDQEFSSDMRSRSVERISDVRLLRSHQFPEDNGPLAHPVRPESFVEINNFYTATVYEKGAELVRMIHTILGEEKFRKGMDYYLKTYDGTAATVEEFIHSFEHVSGQDFSQFKLWYEQAGTPEISIEPSFDESNNQLELDITQSLAPTPGQNRKKPQHIPIRIGLIGNNGEEVELKPADPKDMDRDVIHLKSSRKTVKLTGVGSKPVISALRGFSAPAKLKIATENKDLLFLAKHDQDSFNRWQAIQTYAMSLMLQTYKNIQEDKELFHESELSQTLYEIALDEKLEPAYRALALQLPGKDQLIAEVGQNVDPEIIEKASHHLKVTLAREIKESLISVYQDFPREDHYSPDAKSAGLRSLRNTILAYITADHSSESTGLAYEHFKSANNMTDKIAALSVLSTIDQPQRDKALSDFFEDYSDDPLVVDKWLMLNATSRREHPSDHVSKLTNHASFSWNNPNRVRSLIGAFAMSNIAGFHQKDGSGYKLVSDAILKVDEFNPQLAARLLNSFRSWRMFEPTRRSFAKSALNNISKKAGVSRDVQEIANRSLD